ncbi:ribonuclease PH [Achromatium sp. WMS2]|nr:ribonuclease PH [Achromatium sp. WMS2]
MRPSQRLPNELRAVSFQRQFTRYAAGSVLATLGHTKVLCTASITESVPYFLKGKGQGWITAEYGMLPNSTHQRTVREAVKGQQQGRTLEIQRLIGRSLRATLDLHILGERTITLDCDVLQADGGTRTAAINGAWLALQDAVTQLIGDGHIPQNVKLINIAAVSVGVYQGQPILDLDYAEDSAAGVDMNVVMNSNQEFIEIQGTAERTAFSKSTLDNLLELATLGNNQIMAAQLASL